MCLVVIICVCKLNAKFFTDELLVLLDVFNVIGMINIFCLLFGMSCSSACSGCGL